MRRPLVVLGGIGVGVVLLLVVVAATTRERRAFTLGVVPAGPVITYAATGVACQTPITPPDRESDFDRVAFTLGTVDGRPGPRVDVEMQTLDGRTFARGTVPAGYRSTGPIPERVAVGHVTTRAPMRVCLRNAGPTSVAVYGNGDLASRTSRIVLDGKPLGVDMALSFEHAEPRSAVSILPSMLGRASLWRAGWFGAWTYWVLAAVVLLAVPALLTVALRGALDER